MSRKCRRLIEWFWAGPMRSKQSLFRLAPKSWKFARLQKVSQTNALAWRVTQEFKTEFSSTGTRILKFCECPEIVTDQWNGLGRVGACECARVCECVHVCIYDSL